MEMRNTSKKRNFSDLEIETIMSKDVRKMQYGQKLLLWSTVLASTIELQLRSEYVIYTSGICILYM